MDYKYITQLLERYWECQTTLEEENILRAFFSQDDIRDLFVYETVEPKTDVLGQEFDDKILAIISEGEPVKAKIVSMRQRMMPLFRAVAAVAIFLTVGNAMQMSLNTDSSYDGVAGYETPDIHGVNMAKHDTIKVDSLHRSSLQPMESQAITPIYE